MKVTYAQNSIRPEVSISMDGGLSNNTNYKICVWLHGGSSIDLGTVTKDEICNKHSYEDILKSIEEKFSEQTTVKEWETEFATLSEERKEEVLLTWKIRLLKEDVANNIASSLDSVLANLLPKLF